MDNAIGESAYLPRGIERAGGHLSWQNQGLGANRRKYMSMVVVVVVLSRLLVMRPKIKECAGSRGYVMAVAIQVR